MSTPSLRRFNLLLTLTLSLSCVSRAQTGSGASVRMSGRVSETVSLSIPQAAEPYNAGLRVTSTRNADGSLSVTLSGTSCDLTEAGIPIQIRSNTAYRLLAAAKSTGPNLSSLLVVDVRTTGDLAAPEAAEAVSVATAFDGRRGARKSPSFGRTDRPDISAPSEILNGPRVSLGGTLQSPRNAVEVTLSLAVEPQPGCEGWAIDLLLSAQAVGNDSAFASRLPLDFFVDTRQLNPSHPA